MLRRFRQGDIVEDNHGHCGIVLNYEEFYYPFGEMAYLYTIAYAHNGRKTRIEPRLLRLVSKVKYIFE